MKKGVSLPVHVVVILILAAIVLAAVLFLFMGAGGRSQTEISARFEQGRWCGRYAELNPECKVMTVDENILKGIANACSDLGYATCIKNSPASLECVQRCCGNYCAGKPCRDNSECKYPDPGGGPEKCCQCCEGGVCRIGTYCVS